MLIKLIECTPKAGQAEAFSKAQAAWTDLGNCEGFHGQFGGWESRHQQPRAKAIVLAFWQNQACIDSFMATAHDKIFAANKQVDTYHQCSVSYMHIEMMFTREYPTSFPPITEIGFVHVTHGVIVAKDKEHFLAVQGEKLKEIRVLSGLLASSLAVTAKNTSEDGPNRDTLGYAIMTFWADEQAYQHHQGTQMQYVEAPHIVDETLIKAVKFTVNRRWDVK